ncbi:MAG TPA: hypothetical protein VFC77_04255 [Myxococcota bacterium]|nr:hypothetical protein [Myxococcota bacterium]
MAAARPPRGEGAVPAGIAIGEDGAARCFWCAGDVGYRAYHDGEWGFPSADDRLRRPRELRQARRR